MYVIFRVYPYSGKMARTLQKSPKVYFFDISDVEGDDGARFENLVACALLKRCHFVEDCDGYRMHLHYIRDKEGREVDFAIVQEKKLKVLIEAKWTDHEPASSLVYFGERMKPEKPLCQIVGQNLSATTTRKGIQITPACSFLRDLSPWI
jgi:predicted AAA+ superfamily ATPase